MEQIRAYSCSPLEKVFTDREISFPEFNRVSALRGEETAFQIVLKREGGRGPADYTWDISSPANNWIEVFKVENVPCDLSAYPEEDAHDGDYLTLSPGLFPDLLRPVDSCKLVLSSYRLTVLWVNIKVPPDAPAGDVPITLSVEGQGTRCEVHFTLEVIPMTLPGQKLLFTQWFHLDCLAQYYKVPVFSERHWEIISNYMLFAARHGINTILTPVITPPLDTEIGGERLPVQLTEITRDERGYSFEFSRLRRFIRIALDSGITNFEVCQLFSQWGARYAPNIYAMENGGLKRIFGWETDADDPEYLNFLRALLPEVLNVFREMGVDGKVFFHISDEPTREHLPDYKKRREFLREVLGDVPVMDAINDLDFEELIDIPVVATNHIDPFIKRGTKNLWAYTCCGQNKDVGNRFFAMPSYRNRALGLQLYKFRIKGFLQWGFNFWNSYHSRREINPYITTDGDGAFPGGDAFSVYPGENGLPLPSLRLKVFLHATEDLGAITLLETYIGRDACERLIPGYEEISFSSYPRNAGYYLSLREKINSALKEVAG